MSTVAEFAAELHLQTPSAAARAYTPVECVGSTDCLHDIRAVIFDVYGTLIDYRKDEFGDQVARERSLLAAFAAVVERFGLREAFLAMSPSAPPERTLADFYHGLIAMEHQKKRKDGVETPEVAIDRIWGLIVLMLKRRGWDAAAAGIGDDAELARCMAYFYNFHALGRGFYPGVVDALAKLTADNLSLGILSNAQFYTPIDLTLFTRDQGGGRYDDHLELFHTDLVFFSYEYGVAKPGMVLFEKLFNLLYEMQILPSQAVFVGNDLSADIEPAQRIGLRTALFCGDSRTAYLGNDVGRVIPDIVFTDYAHLPSLIRFHGENKTQ